MQGLVLGMFKVGIGSCQEDHGEERSGKKMDESENRSRKVIFVQGVLGMRLAASVIAGGSTGRCVKKPMRRGPSGLEAEGATGCAVVGAVDTMEAGGRWQVAGGNMASVDAMVCSRGWVFHVELQAVLRSFGPTASVGRSLFSSWPLGSRSLLQDRRQAIVASKRPWVIACSHYRDTHCQGHESARWRCSLLEPMASRHRACV